jgi:hypothetical protein
MFNNNNSARENSFMGDSNNTIGNIHQDKTMNSTSPNFVGHISSHPLSYIAS